MKHYNIGIDLGGTTIKVGLFSPDGKLIAQQRENTESSKGVRNSFKKYVKGCFFFIVIC